MCWLFVYLFPDENIKKVFLLVGSQNILNAKLEETGNGHGGHPRSDGRRTTVNSLRHYVDNHAYESLDHDSSEII